MIKCNVTFASGVSALATAEPVTQADSYEVVDVTTEQQYMPDLGITVTVKKIVTSYYSLVDGEYVLVNQKLEIVNEFLDNENYDYNQVYQSPAPIILPDISDVSLTCKRISNKASRLSWNAVPNCDGYIIYCSTKENGNYTPVKTIDGDGITTCTIRGHKKKQVYYFKVCAFSEVSGQMYYSELSDCVQSESYMAQRIYNKLIKLKKRFPDGKYWNHKGYKFSKNQDVSGFVTDRPCNHKNKRSSIAASCNYYYGRDKVLGYQCWGFASLLSDKVFGKASYSRHKKYKKAKVGDHVRYGNHSVIIVEKYDTYIIAAEANYGGTCMIKWGRIIPKSSLRGATYYTRY